MKHSAAIRAPRQEAAAPFSVVKGPLLAQRHRLDVRPNLRDPARPGLIYSPSTYVPMDIRLVSRSVSVPSSSAPTIDLTERTLVPHTGGRPEVISRWETIGKTINEKIHQQVERSVREQVERTVRTESVLAQRLSREIQSELYRGIVVERERLGLR